jgi:uncharacterized membrane protein
MIDNFYLNNFQHDDNLKECKALVSTGFATLSFRYIWTLKTIKHTRMQIKLWICVLNAEYNSAVLTDCTQSSNGLDGPNTKPVFCQLEQASWSCKWCN